jgi:polyferredoxin
MNRRVWVLMLVLLLGPAMRAAPAIERFPPPDFTDHQIPSTTAPAPDRPLAAEYIDLAVYVGGLCLATYLALVRRGRLGLFLLAVFSLVWLGFVREGCVCSVGSIQDVAEAVANHDRILPYSVIALFSLPILFTLFFGRTFCAGVCPLGAVQELIALRPVRVPRWLDQTLSVFPYVYLGLAVVYAVVGTQYAHPNYLICSYDPFVGLFRRSADLSMLVLAACFLIVGLFVGRPYCRYLCPYGAILGLCSKLSKRHVRIPPDECIKCRLCEDACPYGAILPPTVAPTSQERRRGRRRLACLLVAAPLLIGLGIGLGRQLGVPLSHLHPTVTTAERVRLEQLGQVEGTTDASDAFRNTGRPAQELFDQALALQHDYTVAGAWLGGWVGLVIASKLIYLSIRRRRESYQPDKAVCVSCGRCFWYCPPEQVRLGIIQAIPESLLPVAKNLPTPAAGTSHGKPG